MPVPISPTYIFAVVFAVVLSTNAYSKYGRSCKDIGCLPSEVCAMAYETCSYSQREGKDCGGYPTCKRNTNSGGQTPGASLNTAPDNTVFNQPLNPPRSSQEHNNPNYNNPAPPVDPNSIFGSPVNNQQPTWNNYPVFPIQTQRTPPYPQPYPQIPQSQPMPQYPYGVAPPYQPPPQQPFAFGNPPPPRNYPTYYTTTKEPSLWNQFLNNKQGGKKSGATSSTLIASSISIILSSIYVVMLH